MKEEYIIEKVDAYECAINALLLYESSGENEEIGLKLRKKLSTKLRKEIQRWVNKYADN